MNFKKEAPDERVTAASIALKPWVRHVRKSPVLLAIGLALTLCQCSADRTTAQVQGGVWTVNFFAHAKSDFDEWTDDPSLEQQAWMREHYARMLTYSSYFGPRLAWYPNAWVYKNSYAIYPDSRIFEEHPEWILHDELGNRLFIPYGCKNGTCPQFAGDVGDPAFRRHWIESLRETLADGYIGVWIDDVNMLWRVSDGRSNRVTPIDKRTGKLMTLNAWRRYFAEFMEDIRAEFPGIEIAHNSIWYATPIDDASIVRQIRAADYINLERGATDDGIVGGRGRYGFETFLSFIDRVHAMGGRIILDDDDSDTTAERDYELAVYLLVNDGGDLLGADGDRSRMNPESFWEGYTIDIGRPHGSRYTGNNGLLRRDYECGFVVLNPPDAPLRHVNVPPGYRTIDGRRPRSLPLHEYRAAVLLSENCRGGRADAP